MRISRTILLIEFDKLIINTSLYHKGEILTELKKKNINFGKIEYDKNDEINNLIKIVCETYEGAEVVLCHDNNIDEENKKKIGDIIGNIKTFCQEKIKPTVKIFEYEKNDIIKNVIKFTNSMYEN